MPAAERPPLAGTLALLAPFPGRMEFAARLALACALTTLAVEIYQTPEPALTAYVVFFLIRPDRTGSVVVGVAMLLLITLIVGALLLVANLVIDYPLRRVLAMAVISFCLLFAASASKLKPIAGTVALIVAYVLDLLGSAHLGEIATRALLYAWLFVGIPAAVSITVNLCLGPSPRRLAERSLAQRLLLCASMLRRPDAATSDAFHACLREGPDQCAGWLKLTGLEKTSPPEDVTALQQATRSTAVLLILVDVITRGAENALPAPIRERIACTLEAMAAILRKSGYPVEVALEPGEEEAVLSPHATALLAELRAVLSGFAEPPSQEPAAPPEARPARGFFLPDAFTNPAHVQHALKTTAAAMICYLTYSLLNWPEIHTALITCYIVSLGTTAETIEKLTLRIVGCLLGAAAGIAAIVFVMPGVSSIGVLMTIIFAAALVSGWIAAGSPRISYVGFQIAFAFFLCTVQGASPAFDMTLARDRIIGILFGNLVVALIFTQVWPQSVAQRIDPALSALLRKLAALAAVAGKPRRRALAIETWTALRGLLQDLDLTRYEPIRIRPAPGWLERRRRIAEAVTALPGLLLLDTGHAPAQARRLDSVAGLFEAQCEPQAPIAKTVESSPAAAMQAGKSVATVLPAFLERPLAELEQAVAQVSGEEEPRADYALA